MDYKSISLGFIAGISSALLAYTIYDKYYTRLK